MFPNKRARRPREDRLDINVSKCEVSIHRSIRISRAPLLGRDLAQPAIDIPLRMSGATQYLALIPPLCDGAGFELPLLGRGDLRGERLAPLGYAIRMALEPSNAPGEQFAPVLTERPIGTSIGGDASKSRGMALIVKAYIRSFFFCHV